MKTPELVVCLSLESTKGTPIKKQRELINSLAAQAHSGAMDEMGIILISPIRSEDSKENFCNIFNDRYIGHTTILDTGPYYAPTHQRYTEIMAFLRSRNWPNINWIAFDNQKDQYPEKHQHQIYDPTGENVLKAIALHTEAIHRRDSAHVA